MNSGLKILLYVLLAVFALAVLKFIIKVSLLVAAVAGVLLLLGLVAKEKLR